MRPKVGTTFFSIFTSSVFLAIVSFTVWRDTVDILSPLVYLTTSVDDHSLAIREEKYYAIQEKNLVHGSISSLVSPIHECSISTVSVLLPAWEVLVIVSPESSESIKFGDGFFCLFPDKETSQARYAGVLPFTNRTTFKCLLPNRTRRRLPFPMPILTRSPGDLPGSKSPVPEMMRWSFLVYESFSTESDIVLFAKGVNHRQGINRPPSTLRCVFGDDVINGVRTNVTVSEQEVFRCSHPPPVSLATGRDGISSKITIEILDENRVTYAPSVAYYTPARSVVLNEPKSLLCVSTMVYNVGKFLKEWIMYHSKIGVDRFILYDNDSNDDLKEVVEELVRDGYDVKTLFWIWPKTQEAGFSHGALYAKESCAWVAFIDVDEFVFSPAWLNSSQPSINMMRSLLPENKNQVGQIAISCNDFGPSNQKSHPIDGVTQGYTCRRKQDQRHKSIVFLEAIDNSLLNVIHHFKLNQNYSSMKLSLRTAVVNHYKYQAWPEFKAKFRRRVSAYVVDWTEAVNPMSKDRTPGLGFSAVEPEGWASMFCEIRDSRLKELTRRWFAVESPFGNRRIWQR